MRDDRAARRKERSVLLLGSSAFVFSETGEAGSMPSLVQRELEHSTAGVDWRCAALVLYQTPSSGERAAELLSLHRPDVVVFELGTYQFLHKAVTIRVRRRWPALYESTVFVMDQLKPAGGNKFEGSSGLRGSLFRVPRAAAYRIVGAEAAYDVETCMRFAFAILDEVLRHEHILLVCAMPRFQWWEAEVEWARAQVRTSAEALTRYCAQHHVTTYDVERELAAADQAIGLARDVVHYDLQTREFEARLIAEKVRCTLDM